MTEKVNEAEMLPMESPMSTSKPATAIEKMIFRYSRSYGFSKCNWGEFTIKSSKRAESFVRQYSEHIEKQSQFRDISTRKIETALLVFALMIFLLILTIGDIIVGAICMFTILGIVYFLSIRKGIKVKQLRSSFDLKLEGSDFEYFGVTINNKIGNYHWLVYALIPCISSSVYLILEVHPKKIRTNSGDRIMQNGAQEGQKDYLPGSDLSRESRIAGGQHHNGRTQDINKDIFDLARKKYNWKNEYISPSSSNIGEYGSISDSVKAVRGGDKRRSGNPTEGKDQIFSGESHDTEENHDHLLLLNNKIII